MAPPTYASPFPKLELTVEEKENLYNTANALIDEAQAMYESYLWEFKSSIDDGRWDIMKERDEMKVFRDRRPGAGTGNKDMHLLLTTGMVPGTLNDALYGILNHSTDDIRIKTSYVKDTLTDMAVLETIQEPTVEEPFQSLTVRWFVKGVPLHVRAISKHQDYVNLQATGTRRLRNGELIGFHLLHSVSFDKTPPLPNYERINLSLCGLYRQATPTKVQAFMTSYFEIKESFVVPMVLKSLAEAVIAKGKVIECGQHKKLAYLVRNKDSFVVHDTNGHDGDSCYVCGSISRSSRRGVKSQCSICSKNTCGRCRIKRELSFFAPDRQLMRYKMRFCVPCIKTAERLDGAVVARSEVAENLAGESKKMRAHESNMYGAAIGDSFSSKSSSTSRDPMSSVSTMSELPMW